MIADYLDAEETGGSKNSLEITVDVKADKVLDFAHEIRDAVVEEMLEIIAELKNDNIGRDGSDEYTSACQDFRAEVEALKGGEQE